MDSIVLGGGCFWCVEASFLQLRGVTGVVSGYAGGTVASPSYDAVCSGSTGHAEVVKIVFNSAEITLDDVLTVFFAIHDPTTRNRQGHDIGTQYRSAIYTTNAAQLEKTHVFLRKLEKEAIFDAPLTTEVAILDVFYPAEEYHQRYYEKNPSQGYCSAVISPKLGKLRERFVALLK